MCICDQKENTRKRVVDVVSRHLPSDESGKDMLMAPTPFADNNDLYTPLIQTYTFWKYLLEEQTEVPYGERNADLEA